MQARLGFSWTTALCLLGISAMAVGGTLFRNHHLFFAGLLGFVDGAIWLIYYISEWRAEKHESEKDLLESLLMIFLSPLLVVESLFRSMRAIFISALSSLIIAVWWILAAVFPGFWSFAVDDPLLFAIIFILTSSGFLTACALSLSKEKAGLLSIATVYACICGIMLALYGFHVLAS